MKDQSEIEKTHLRKALLDELFKRSQKEPMIFGYYLGEAAALTGAMSLFEEGISKISADGQNDYIKGIARAVAFKDLGAFGVMVLRDENLKKQLESQSNLAYQYIRGIMAFKGLISGGENASF